MTVKIYGEDGAMFRSGKQYVSIEDYRAALKDAERYRWLREQRDEQQPVVTIAKFRGAHWGEPWRDEPLWGDELDAAVDAAMRP